MSKIITNFIRYFNIYLYIDRSKGKKIFHSVILYLKSKRIVFYTIYYIFTYYLTTNIRLKAVFMKIYRFLKTPIKNFQKPFRQK